MIAAYVILHEWLVSVVPNVRWPNSGDVGTVALLAVTFLYVQHTARLVRATRDAGPQAELRALHDQVISEAGALNVLGDYFADLTWDSPDAWVDFPALTAWATELSLALNTLVFGARARAPRVPSSLRPSISAYESAVSDAASAFDHFVVCACHEASLRPDNARVEIDLNAVLTHWDDDNIPGQARLVPVVPLADVRSGAVFSHAVDTRRALRGALEQVLYLN